MNWDLLTSFFICLISAIAGSLVVCHFRLKNWDLLKCGGLAVLSGFVSFLIVLLINVAGVNWYYLEEVIVGFFYPIILGDSRFFSRR